MKNQLMKICFATLVFTASNPVLASDVGEVNFKTSCSTVSEQKFNHGLALSHHMMYVQAEQVFQEIVDSEQDCAMAYWGLAFTQVHPLWGDTLSDQKFEQGLKLLQTGLSQLNLTPIEKGMIESLKAYYQDWEKTDETKRFIRWEKAQFELHQKYPNEPETTALYALLHLATAPKSDKSYKHQKEAGELLEKLHKSYPRHPAGYHYTIHAYDNPVLAKQGEYYARGYDAIAPEVPHALHMPTHIFVRLGLWPETISWNTRSAKAAKGQPMPNGAYSMHYAHALDYLMYAYLQQNDFDSANKVLQQLNQIDDIQPIFASGYGIAATRARFYLEQKLWQEASNLPLTQPSGYPWDDFVAAKAITVFARGLGQAHTGDIEAAQNSLVELHQYKSALEKDKKYWATLTEAKANALKAMIGFKQGKLSEAIKIMAQAAELEDSLDKHPVTPGEPQPIRELYGDLLLKDKQPDLALEAYQDCLAINPNRNHCVQGVARVKLLKQQNQVKRQDLNQLQKSTDN